MKRLVKCIRNGELRNLKGSRIIRQGFPKRVDYASIGI